MQRFQLLFLSMLLLFLHPGILWAAEETSTAGPGDSQNHYFWFPIFYESPETGFAIGGMFMGYRDSDPALSREQLDILQGALVYTEKEQLIGYLGLKKYFQDDRYLLMASAGYTDFHSKFYGIGPATDEDQEEEYTFISYTYSGSFLWQLAPGIYFGPIVAYGRFDVEDQTAGGLLDGGDINGHDGTTVTGAGFQLLWDTRDQAFLPQHGSVLDAKVTSYRRDWGSDEDFSQLIASYRQFRPLGQSGTLALMTVLELSDGTVPFEMMPCLGGQTIMRGYYEGRYRDRNYAALQGEYRFPISPRFSGVIFASLGEVAPEIDRFTTDHLQTAAGCGVRFRIDPQQKINLRLDVGLSESGVYGYLNFMEAF
jgi:outer membrane protein assembly factor BamA